MLLFQYNYRQTKPVNIRFVGLLLDSIIYQN
jgi:hypothetical protein